MRGVVICLVALACASVVAAGFFGSKQKGDVAVDEEGVVIGIQRDGDGKTKVSVSPQDVDSANRQEEEEEGVFHKLRAGEVICDAYGKCKEKIESFVGRTKEAAEETAEDAVEKVSKAGQAAKEATGKAKLASDKAQKMKENIKDAATEASSKVKDKLTKKATEAKEGAKEAEKMAKNTAKRGLKGILGILLSPAPGVLHLLGFATAYGTCVWVTFASNYVLARALPRQQLAVVQSRMYPLYFKAMAFSVGTALAGYLAGHRGRFSPFGLGVFRGFDLMAPLVMVLVNLLYLEPRAAKVMSERMKKEKEEGSRKEGDAGVTDRGAVGTKAAGGGTAADAAGEGEQKEATAAAEKEEPSVAHLRTLNSHSSLLNIATLMSLTWHLVHLGHNLHSVC